MRRDLRQERTYWIQKHNVNVGGYMVGMEEPEEFIHQRDLHYQLEEPIETYSDVEPQPESFDPLNVDVDYLHGGTLPLEDDAAAYFSQKGRRRVPESEINRMREKYDNQSGGDGLFDLNQDLLAEFLAHTENQELYPEDPDYFEVTISVFASDTETLDTAEQELNELLPEDPRKDGMFRY